MASEGSVPRASPAWNDAAFRLHDANTGGEGLPRLAVSGDAVLAVWQRADGTENQVRMSLLNLQGRPRWSEPRTLDVEVRGASVAGRTWMPDVVALPDAGWAVAATVADEGWGGFRSYVALLDEEGVSQGPAIPLTPEAPALPVEGEEEDPDVAAERDRWHESPTVAVGPGGALWVAWDRRSSDKDDVEVAVLRPDGAGGWEASGPVRVLAAEPNAVAAPAFARVAHTSGERMWLAVSVFSADAPAMVVDVTALDAIGAPVDLATEQRAFRTRLVQVDGGGVLAAWQARDGATSARGVLRTRWLEPTEGGFEPAGEVEQADMRGRTTHLVYPLALVARGEDAVLPRRARRAAAPARERIRHPVCPMGRSSLRRGHRGTLPVRTN